MSDKSDLSDREDSAQDAKARARGRAGGKRTAFKKVDTVLNRVLANLGLDKRLKEHTLMNLWPAIVGEPWSRKSRSLFVDADLNLVVTVCDAATGQELSLMKPRLLKQLQMAGQAVGLNVNGLRFDLKHFHTRPLAETAYGGIGAKTLPEPSNLDLSRVELTESDRQDLFDLKQSLGTGASLAGISPERILAVFERDLRIKRWQAENGYPRCSACQLPSAHLLGSPGLCAPCHYQGIS